MDKGFDQALLVFFVLFVRAALELGQHENKLVTIIDGSGRGFNDGRKLVAQGAFLFFEVAEPGGKAGRAGAVLNGPHDIVLLADVLGKLCFQRCLFGVIALLVGDLHGDHAVGDFFQLAGSKNIIGGSGHDQVFKESLFDIVLVALMLCVAGAGIIIMLLPVLAGAGNALHAAVAQLAEQLPGQHIVCADSFRRTPGAVQTDHDLHLVPQFPVDDGGKSVLDENAVGLADIGADILRVGDDPHNAVLVERLAGGSGQPFIIQIGDDGGGGLPGGILLEDVANGRGLLLVNHILMVLIGG